MFALVCQIFQLTQHFSCLCQTRDIVWLTRNPTALLNMKKPKAQSSLKGNTRYTLRLPAELLEKLKERARKSTRSVAGEMVNALRHLVGP